MTEMLLPYNPLWVLLSPDPGAFIHSLNKLFSQYLYCAQRSQGNRRKEQPLLTGFLQEARPCDRGSKCEFNVINNV